MTMRAARHLAAPTGLFVDGAWRPASDGATDRVVDPATEQVIATVPDATDADVDAALAAAAEGFRTWREVSAWERSAGAPSDGRHHPRPRPTVTRR